MALNAASFPTQKEKPLNSSGISVFVNSVFADLLHYLFAAFRCIFCSGLRIKIKNQKSTSVS